MPQSAGGPAAEAAEVEVCRDGRGRCSTEVGDVILTVEGGAADPVEVKPPSGHPLSTIDRDAGVAVTLRDGSALWLFGDTAARTDQGDIAYFTIGTGSWARAGSPAVTEDFADPLTGEPVRLAEPTAEFADCPSPTDVAGMWPAAAVVQPVGPRDRVVIWFENICLTERASLSDQGMSVGEWWYDPADPPVGRPIRATILRQNLFPNRSYASAAIVDADGSAVVYRCRNAPLVTSADQVGPCWSARVPLDQVADPSAYREWNGSAFAAAVGEGLPLELPEASTWPYPPGGFTVAFDPSTDLHFMAYSPWPGQTEAIDLRIAEHPAGPWSAPITVHIDGCLDEYGGRLHACYAATPQPLLSGAGKIGVGYYDALRSRFPLRGSYVVSQLPVTVTRRAAGS